MATCKRCSENKAAVCVKCIGEITGTADKQNALFNAVDDYLYDTKSHSYPDDHFNPEFLADLRLAFLKASEKPDTDDLLDALRPFAALDVGSLLDTVPLCHRGDAVVTAGDVRRARAALERAGGGNEDD